MRNRIEVKLALTDNPLSIGTIVRDDRRVYFRCAQEYLASPLNISPFKLPKNLEVQQANTNIFTGLHGVFADSLPDGWGRLTLDRSLAEKGIRLSEITPLDRLAYVGENGMGALTYHPVEEEATGWKRAVDLDQLADDSRKLLAGESVEVVDQLVQLGGSSGGARPKILVGYNPQTDEIIPDSNSLPKGYEHWLIKFPASVDPEGVANIEFAYHKMALAAGLDMMPCKLFTGRSEQQFFGTKRFDRIGNNRLHLHSAAGLMHDNFRLTNMDYGHVMDAVLRLENDLNGPAKVLRLAAFNVFAHNRDDHSKNISLLLDAKGNWRLAPAYDLTYSQSGHGHHSLTVAGEGLAPSTRQLLELASEFNVNEAETIINKVKQAVADWGGFAEEAGVNKAYRQEISLALYRGKHG